MITDEDIERKRKEHVCLYNDCNQKLEPEFYSKGVCPMHLWIIIMKKSRFPKEVCHPSYEDRLEKEKKGFAGYGIKFTK